MGLGEEKEESESVAPGTQPGDGKCDVSIALDDGAVIHLQGVVLSACSVTFNDMVANTLQPTDHHANYRLANITADTMHVVLDHAYQRDVHIGHHNAVSVLTAADYLGIDGLLELCCEFLRKQLSPLNCIGIMRLSQQSGPIVRLAAAARRYALQHFLAVATDSTELLELPLPDMVALLGEDSLNSRSEKPVWECALRWIAHSPEQRRLHLKQLLSSVRLGLLDAPYFLEKVKGNSWVLGQDECRPIMMEALKVVYRLDKILQDSQETSSPKIALRRVPCELLFAIGGLQGDSGTNFVETYDTRVDRWVRVDAADPAGPRAHHGAAVFGYKIYVIGGLDGSECCNSCRCFDAETKTWTEVLAACNSFILPSLVHGFTFNNVASMNFCRGYVSVAVAGEAIFAMGGSDGKQRHNSAERLNHECNQWVMIAPMRRHRADASATTLDGRIYIAGGFNGQAHLDSAEVYDLESDQWTMIAAMSSPRTASSCIAYHGHVYAIGGLRGISRMRSGERYDPKTNTWSPIPDMRNPRSHFGIAVVDDMIFCVGGFTGLYSIDFVEYYDEKTREWTATADMHVYRSALAACVVVGLPHVEEYIHKQRDLLEERRQSMSLPSQGLLPLRY